MGDIGTLKFDNPEREKQRQDSESEPHRRSAWLPAQRLVESYCRGRINRIVCAHEAPSTYVEFHQTTNHTFDPYMPIVGALLGGIALAILSPGIYSLSGELAIAGSVCQSMICQIVESRSSGWSASPRAYPARLRQQTFDTAIIERYRRRESSVEEALIERYLARGLRAPGGGHHGGFVGHGHIALDSIGSEREDLRNGRGVAQPADRERTPLCLPGRHRAQAQLGGRDPQRVGSG